MKDLSTLPPQLAQYFESVKVEFPGFSFDWTYGLSRRNSKQATVVSQNKINVLHPETIQDPSSLITESATVQNIILKGEDEKRILVFLRPPQPNSWGQKNAIMVWEFHQISFVKDFDKWILIKLEPTQMLVRLGKIVLDNNPAEEDLEVQRFGGLTLFTSKDNQIPSVMDEHAHP